MAWTKRSYHTDGGHWEITDGHIHFDIHPLYDGSGRRDKYPDGVIVSPAEANKYADQVLEVLNKHLPVVK